MVNSIAFSPDDCLLALGFGNGEIQFRGLSLA